MNLKYLISMKKIDLEDNITELEDVNETVDFNEGVDVGDDMLDLKLDFEKLKECVKAT